MFGDLRTMRGRLVWDGEHYEQVIEAIAKATVSVWVATANLKDVHVRTRSRRYTSLLAVFDELARKGVELRILHAGMPSRPFRDSFDKFPKLTAGALQLRQCPRVHMKAVLVDGQFCYLGSANLTGAGLGVKHDERRNFELGFVTDDERILDEVQARFQSIWSGGSCSRCRLRKDGCEAPLDLALETPTDRTIVRIRVAPRVETRRTGGKRSRPSSQS